MKAKKKPLEVMDGKSLGVDFSKALVEQIEVADPPKRTAGKKVSTVDELLTELKSKAQVL
jgi:electron transfer flavoprotein beta subunit